MKWFEVEYIRNASETVQPCMLDDDTLVYVHYVNGYFSLFDSLKALHEFLNGDTSARRSCFSDEEGLESALKTYSEAIALGRKCAEDIVQAIEEAYKSIEK